MISRESLAAHITTNHILFDEEVILRIPSCIGRPICMNLVSVGEDVHCEPTAQEIRAQKLT